MSKAEVEAVKPSPAAPLSGGGALAQQFLAASEGANQQGLRDHNERLLLTLIHRRGALPGIDLARLAGLSPQTVSVILRKLEAEGLVKRGEPQRGRIGKPSVPMALDPDGVFAFGLKIGRRSSDLVLIDFHGRVRGALHLTYAFPTPDRILGFLARGIAQLSAELAPGFITELGAAPGNRIAGIGVALPFRLWDWHYAEAPGAEALELWRDIDLPERIAAFSDLPVHVQNDATAACRAEQVYGRGKDWRDFAYFYVGAFIGGGLVINHTVFEGPQGNAGSFGSLPARRQDGSDCQLIDAASLFMVEGALDAQGFEPGLLWRLPQDWSGVDAVLDPWIRHAGEQIAQAALAVCAVVDVPVVVIDGAMPATVLERLVETCHDAVARLDQRGLTPLVIEAGVSGVNARAVGAATGPMFLRYFLNTHSVF